MKVGYKMSEESLRKMSEAQRGENNPMYGRHHTEETKMKMRKPHRPFSEGTKRKMSEAKKGVKKSEETKRKMSEAQKNRHHTHKGTPCSEETKEKIRQSNLKRLGGRTIHQYDLNGIFVAEYSSLNEIVRKTGYDIGKLSKCCNGKCKTGYGFIWKREVKEGMPIG